MRIRKKKHLKERLLMVNDMVIVPKRDVPNVLEAVKLKDYFNFNNIFNNDNPVELEIGCGKGGFVIEMASRNPSKNFVAVEMLENIIVMAAENAKSKGLKNLIFVNSGAEYLPRYIKEGSIDNVYLNFSPPYPQDGYEGRRLTNPRLVENYYSYLKEGGAVYQKTDDRPFFEYSFKKLEEGGFNVVEVSEDIEKGIIENVCTEYESKFRKEGVKINALIATKRK
jgi:tRNA (guanine-N7-)-methyltransferase